MPSWRVPTSAKGEKLVQFLKSQLGDDFSGRRLKVAIEANNCRINGVVERHASTRLRGGEKIDFDQPKEISKRTSIQDISVVFEDEALVIYDKPPGVISDSSFGLLVNRLDRGTTGILVVAKSQSTLEAMIAQYKERIVKKEYLALVDGIIEEEKGIVDNHLGKLHAYEGQTLWGAVPEGGVRAITHWKCLERGEEATLVKCEPITGKTHQLRVHLLEMGHPVLGDYQYGRKKILCHYPAKRVLLHAHRLGFEHPVTKKWMDVKAPIPEDFYAAQKALL